MTPGDTAFPKDPIDIWKFSKLDAACMHDREAILMPYNSISRSDKALPAMIICPGGSYRLHAEHEGKGYADWLTQYGIACFVLKYRLGINGHHYPAPFQDLERSVRIIRMNAAFWGLDADRIGVIGSSAGGHLASMLITRFSLGQQDAKNPIDRESSRPNIGVLCYPVISMEENAHIESSTNLMGSDQSLELKRLLSSDLQVSKNSPPCFIWHTYEDTSVNVGHSLAFAKALRQVNVPFELHVYETGRHGMGLQTEHPWGKACITWMYSRQFII